MLDPTSIAARLKEVKPQDTTNEVSEESRGSPSPAPESMVPRVPSVPSTATTTPSPSPTPGFGLELGPGLGGFGLPAGEVVTTVVSKNSGGMPGGKSRKEKQEEEGTKGMLNPRCLRQGGDGMIWEDPSMADWPTNDFRLFVGNLGTEVTTEMLAKPFGRYTSFLKAKVIINSRSMKPKGYGFVSFKMAEDGLRALREMEGKHVGTRPITLKKSNWENSKASDAKQASKQLLLQRGKRNQKYHHGVVNTEAFKPY